VLTAIGVCQALMGGIEELRSEKFKVPSGRGRQVVERDQDDIHFTRIFLVEALPSHAHDTGIRQNEMLATIEHMRGVCGVLKKALRLSDWAGTNIEKRMAESLPLHDEFQKQSDQVYEVVSVSLDSRPVATRLKKSA